MDLPFLVRFLFNQILTIDLNLKKLSSRFFIEYLNAPYKKLYGNTHKLLYSESFGLWFVLPTKGKISVLFLFNYKPEIL